MAQSPEYPDLKWMPPRAWGSGRDGKAVRYIVIHYTAGSERATSAEDGARYNQTRTDGTSAHYFVDRDSIIQGVRTKDRANCARHRGNRLGIQYELCGTVQTRAQWLDAASLATLQLAAKQVARDCRKYDIPVRRLTVAQTRAAWTQFPDGPRGIVGHVDCTYAYPEDGGDHTDPGTQFPWDVFLDLVRAEMEEDDMPTAAEIAEAVWDHALEDGYLKDAAGKPVKKSAGAYQRYANSKHDVVALGAKVDAVAAAVAALDVVDDADRAELARQILAGLPDTLAQQLAGELAARLAA